MPTPLRFVSTLSDQQREHLQHVYRYDESHRARQRAHAILLSERRYSIAELARLFETDRDTVARWLGRYEREASLHDAPRSGRPPKLADEERSTFFARLDGEPGQLKATAAEHAVTERVSLVTLRRYLRRAGYSWRRIRRSLRARRDEAAFRRAQAELAELERREAAGELALCYFDAAGFSRTAPVSYAWQKRGQRTEVLSARSSQINVLGWVRRSGAFDSFTLEGAVCSQAVIGCLEALCAGLRREQGSKPVPVVVVLDGASVHRSAAMRAAEVRWREQGVHLYRLPSYSPELNRVELVWQAIKYRWLSLSAYASLEALRSALNEVLVGIGTRHRITFA